MAASAARIRANQANAQKSTGPKTQEVKEQSRQNAYKHGMTGTGVVVAIEDAAEIGRRTAAFQAELKPSGEISHALVRRAAFLSVQLDRSMIRDLDAVGERVRRAEAEFVAPAGVSLAEATHLEAVEKRKATFDPSPAATLARRYETAIERGFYRALRELRQIEKDSKATDKLVSDENLEKLMGSFEQRDDAMDQWLKTMEKSFDLPLIQPRNRPESDYLTSAESLADLPITVGRPR